ARRELEIAPTVHLASPDERLAADLVALDPGEGLVLDVGVLLVLDEEVLVRLAELTGARLDRVLLGALGPDREPRVAQWQLPARLVLRDVVVAVDNVTPALDHQRAQDILRDLLRQLSAGDPPAHLDG